MAIDKFVTAAAAAALIADGDTVALIGGGGGLCEATCLHEAIERRFLESNHPRGLTVIHSLGIGDRRKSGIRGVTASTWVRARSRVAPARRRTPAAWRSAARRIATTT